MKALVVAFVLVPAVAHADERWSLGADALVAQPEHDAEHDWYTGLRGRLGFAISPMLSANAGVRFIADKPGKVDGLYWEVDLGVGGRLPIGRDWVVLANADFINGGVTVAAGSMASTVSGVGYDVRLGAAWRVRENVELHGTVGRSQLWFNNGDVVWRTLELGAAYAW